MRMKSHLNILSLIVLSSFFLFACGKSDNSPDNENTPTTIAPRVETGPQEGYLLDSAVQGVRYTNSNGSQGKTGADGAFTYFHGDRIEFSVGNIVIGNVQATHPPPIGFVDSFGYRITPVTLTPDAENSDDHRVINRLIFLQTLDDDGDPENGIKITDAVHLAAANTVLDFTLPVDDFMSGEFAALVNSLNANQAFSAETPRGIRSEIDALRHFGNLSGFPGISINSSTITYNAWWLETAGCSDIGKSKITIKNESITFCPNISGHDGCYLGVIRSSGDILLPDMLTNNNCATYEPGSEVYEIFNCAGAEYTSIQADLRLIDGQLSGSYEASCNQASNNSKQSLSADFIKIKSEGGSLSDDFFYANIEQTKSDIDDIIRTGSCFVDSDCETLDLRGRYYCSIPEYRAYAPGSVDIDRLLLKQHIYKELTDTQHKSGTIICNIPRAPSSTCFENMCWLQTD